MNRTVSGARINLKVAPQKGSTSLWKFRLAKLILGMPIAVILTLAIYESMYKRLARPAQTISYLPHFLSWVSMFGVFDKLQQAGILQFNQEVSP